MSVTSSFDIAFKFYLDTPAGKDPDTYSPTLHDYHRRLWSKTLPDGRSFELTSSEVSPYRFFHESDLGSFVLSSDSIIHTYSRWKRESMARIIRAIPQGEIEAFYDLASTMGGYILFPSNRVNGQPTLNGIRGFHALIQDRFDLTLECIRRWYLEEKSPLQEDIERYRDFFTLFGNFSAYCHFFLLEDLVCEKTGQIRFWLPFEDFAVSPPLPQNLEAYLIYREKISVFARARNLRMKEYMDGRK